MSDHAVSPVSVPEGAQPGSAQEPVRYTGGVRIDPVPHDGGLRPAIGVANYQTFRANRTHPECADGWGWTYNHAPMLAYWNETFYQEYLSNPVDEHIAPGHTLLVTSRDGRHWSAPAVVFPAYEPPSGTPMPEGCRGYMMHQRMGFYVAPNGRLLVLGFYGHAEDPFGPGGIGRVVREIHNDGLFGPIYFIRYASHGMWNEQNTCYPLYTRSADTGFVEACQAFLANRLMMLQCYEEDPGPEGFYPITGDLEALSFYHRRDGQVVALWKWSLCALSPDEGRTFTPPVKATTLIMDGAKIWGQRTADGRYALVYVPTPHSEHRYPLAIVTGDDGVLFDNLLVVHGEVPPRRFFGRWKDFGPQYVRGIEEGNGTPADHAMWITYSVNKEDMWASRIPVPVRYRVEGPVFDDFSRMETGGFIPDWNIYSPMWAPVRVVNFPSATEKSLELRDEDPCDYAKAVRVFQEGTRATIDMMVLAQQAGRGGLEMEVLDGGGCRPVRLRFDGDGWIKVFASRAWQNLQPYTAATWYAIGLTVQTAPFGCFSVSVDGKTVAADVSLADSVRSVERLLFRTGPYRAQPTRETDNEEPHAPLDGADERAPSQVYNIKDLRIASA